MPSPIAEVEETAVETQGMQQPKDSTRTRRTSRKKTLGGGRSTSAVDEEIFGTMGEEEMQDLV